MSRAFVETTVLVDALLKEGAKKRAALDSIRSFSESLLPVYAIKEFKAGALKNFVWVHNKLVDTGSYEATLAAVQRVSMSPRRYLPATALEALKTVADDYRKLTSAQLVQRYGKGAHLDAMLYDHARLSLKRRIAKAWRQRRRITTSVVCQLPCYVEPSMSFEGAGLIDLSPLSCDRGTACCIAVTYAHSPDVHALERAIPANASRPEDRRRKAALKLVRLGRPLGDKDCRDLGDAVFALQCPVDAVILTTNDRDHRPLASALGKMVSTPL